MRGGMPDRVPVTLGLSEMVPVRYSTDDYVKFFWTDKIPLWKARVATEVDRFGADGFIHLGVKPSPLDPPVEIRDVQELPGAVHYTSVIHTPHGDLSSRYTITQTAPPGRTVSPVQSPDADYQKVMDLLKHPETKDLSDVLPAYQEIGDRAHVGFWLNTPIEWWDGLRGTQNMVMDLCDHPQLMKKIFSAYREYAQALLAYVLSHTPLDSVGLGGSSTSMSVISPDLHREFSLDFGRAICAVARQYDRPVQYHMCGKSRAALAITADMGVSGFDALEAPPTGDVDLTEVKQAFGGTYSLRGNVNSITIMLNGKPRDVERDIVRCMNSAKKGGGYILGVGDQTPYHTPDENMDAFVEYGKKYGTY